ncbi:ion channel [Undibacterium curvum]|uniref:ion channel n=1 Tax=Undibacterium curvum TaxID=2762294 RepID=UPI003D0F6830
MQFPWQRHYGQRITMGGRDVVVFGMERHYWQDIYYYAMTSSWPQFFLAAALVFLSFNLIFASLYMLGDHPIANMAPDNFLGAFFFSVETLATVGYGDMHPQTVYAHWVSTVEIFVGMASVALITGVMFARFSRPRASILFSQYPVSHVADGKQLLLFRIANARLNIISEASAKLRMLQDEETTSMGKFRKLTDLRLERDQHPMFSLGWTIIHVIDANSPLYGKTPEQLKEVNTAFVLTIEGVDETTHQMQRARQYYPVQEIRWNHRFVDVLNYQGSVAHLHYQHFHETVAISESVQAGQ